MRSTRGVIETLSGFFANFVLMKTTRIALVILMTLSVLSLAKAAGKPIPVVSEAALRSMVVENPDSVLGLLDKIENSRNPSLPPFRISLMKALAYNEKRMFAYVYKYASETLQSDSMATHPKEHTNALTLLAVTQSFFGDLQGCVNSCTEAMNMARQSGNLPAELNVLTTMAKTYFALNDRTRGYQTIENIIDKGSDSDNSRVLANVSAAYGVKIIQLYADNRFDEALRESQKRLAVIDKIDRIGGAPDGYTDQQRAYTYARIASSARMAGNLAQAEAAYSSFMNTDYGRSEVGKPYITDYLLNAGKYATVLEFTKPLFRMFEGSDTINIDYHSLLIANASAEAGLGDYSRAFNLMQRANVVQDSLYTREKTTQAQELATVFALNEKQLELEKEKAASQKRLILLWSAGGIILLVVLILIILWWQFQVTRNHNRLAARRIDELMKQREKEQAEKAIDHGFNEDKDAFNHMEQVILKDQLFKDPQFNRDAIVKATGFSRSKVIQLIQTFTGLSPSDYVTKLRIEHSVKLIKEHPDWTIDGIAEGCGYVRRATYYSHFNKFYGITPAQYRKELMKDQAGG